MRALLGEWIAELCRRDERAACSLQKEMDKGREEYEENREQRTKAQSQKSVLIASIIDRGRRAVK